MLESNGLCVWIESDGKPLPVYQVNKELNRTTCYIVSEEGKEFSIGWKTYGVGSSTKEFQLAIYMDGKRAIGKVNPAGSLPALLEGIYETPTSLRRFQFGRLVLTDDDSARRDEATLKELGTIRIEVDAVRVLNIQSTALGDRSNMGDSGPVHEKAKKARSHCTKLGDAVSIPPRNLRVAQTLSLGLPKQDFVFQYAPLDWLQAQEIIPRPSPPPPANHPKLLKRERSPSISLDDESDMKLLDPDDVASINRIKKKLASRKKIKVKAEPDIHVPDNLLDPNAVIDLTSDGDED